MKNIISHNLRKILLIIILLISTVLVRSQDMLHIDGLVTNIVSGEPVVNHEMHIIIDSVGINFSYYNIVLTDDNGYYFDEILIPASITQGILEVGTYDCEQQYHKQLLSWDTNNMYLTADFVICDDTIPDCENFFTYVTGDSLTFTFIGEVIPPDSASYIWDFGDGTTDTGQEVTHTFEPNGTVDFYTVCLTTISYIGGIVPCEAFSCQDVYIGNPGNNILFIDGMVTNIETGVPVINHEMYIIIDSAGANFGYYNIIFTDDNGYYFDEIILPDYLTQGILEVGTYDCEQQYHNQLLSWDPYNMYLTADFIICDSIPGCENFFTYITSDSLTFTFFGEVIPQDPTDYTWDFGDGAIATGQEVTHTFEPNGAVDFYTVCLTTISYYNNSDTCEAVSCQDVYIKQNICQADFYAYPDSNNQFIYHFIDLSIGDITYWFWDFGDGHISELQNPVHTYEEPGEYTVCLTVGNDFTGCEDTFCDLIIIEGIPGCQADFQAVLDTTSNLTNNYYFFDNSIGYPVSWYWDFGDGNNSYEQNPEHQYENSGTYDVCLMIMTNYSPGSTCYDSICKEITTPQYYNLGGLAFIGDKPINNPFNTGDTALTYLYKIYSDNKLVPIDTLKFYEYGYYWFSQIREGNYIIKVELTPNSTNYEQYLPAYHTNASIWQNADIISLSDSNYYYSDTYLIPTQVPNTGQGNIYGYIVLSDDTLSDIGNSVSHVEILLMDINNNPLTYCYTDNEGHFNFTGLEFGTYKLYAEATGKYTYPVTVDLNSGNPTVSNITLEIYENTTGINTNLTNPLYSIGNIYPNPVNKDLNIKINLISSSGFIFKISNIVGQQILIYNKNLNQGEHIITLSVNSLPGGVYILSVISSDGISEQRKFIK
ncbi:MAG: PKD domain-containing protein [Bacteroidales bacterium]|nr:PKD domain-containing protein [Bacteroidales bacterium]